MSILCKSRSELRDIIYKKIMSLEFNKNICDDNKVACARYNKSKWELEYNYILKEDRNKNRNKVKIEQKKNKRIVIILESPHRNEYDIDSKLGYPALGKTGENLNNNLEEIINKKLKNKIKETEVYDIILMNAVQYQTSLGIDTKVFRDRIWLTLWIENDLRNNFIKRLEMYNPDIILNFCSKGDHTKDFITNIIGKDLSKIGNDFINSLEIDNISFKENEVKYRNEVLAKKEKSKDGKKFIGFTLRNFVKNAIQKYVDDNGLIDIKIFRGPHPSSWKSDNKFLDEIK